MSEEEIKRWELWYAETAKRDFERRIYEQCDAEDLERSQPPFTTGEKAVNPITAEDTLLVALVCGGMDSRRARLRWSRRIN